MRGAPRTLHACLLGALLVCAPGLSARAAAQQAPAASAVAERLDGIVAVVGGLAPGPGVVVLYRSDVELRARLALLRERELAVALTPLPDNVLHAALHELLGEALIAVEAARLSLAPPSGVALAEERARLLDPERRVGAPRELLRALGVSERELDAIVERRAVVNGFLQANLEGTLEVSGSELARLFKSEPHPFRALSLDDARERFASWLAQRRMEQAVSRWVQTLDQRTPHRVLVSY